MAGRFRRGLGLALAWLIFPLVPVVLADTYFQTVNFGNVDPHDWGWLNWVLLLGPLVGYGFLAGATLDIPNESDPPRRRWRRLLARRGMWVAVGPWVGFILWAGVYFGLAFLDNLIPANWHPDWQPPGWWKETWVYWGLSWGVLVLMVGTFAYGWLWPAWFALRRAARIGLWGRALYRGLITALAFVGSLFGTFWAITSAWRSYFFDPRVMPLIALTLGLEAMSGCASTITYGEVRRRDLFHALLVAWVLGLALMWRWWSGRRPGPPCDVEGSAGRPV